MKEKAVCPSCKKWVLKKDTDYKGYCLSCHKKRLNYKVTETLNFDKKTIKKLSEGLK